MLTRAIGPDWRRRLAFIATAALVGMSLSALAGCSGGPVAQAQNAPIHVETSEFSVAVQNNVGMPLTDVEVSIVPVGGITTFDKFAGRIENAEKVEFALGQFYGRDGTEFSLRSIRPKSVRVTGKDSTNKAYNVEVPWQ